MPAVTLIRRADNKAHPTAVPESDTGLLAGLELSAAGAASLYADAFTTAITIGSSGITTTVASELQINLTIFGPDDGTGITIGSVPSGASTGSTYQALNVTTAQRDQLIASEGMVVYNTTDVQLQGYADGTWVDMTSPGGGASLSGVYRFSTTITDSDPGSGNFRLNNATQASATQMFFSDQTRDGFDASNILLALKTGDRIYVQEEKESSRFHLFLITGPAVDATTYVRVPVSSVVAGTDLRNNKDCGTILLFTGRITTPSSSTDNGIVRWNGTAGDTVQDSALRIADSGALELSANDGTGVVIGQVSSGASTGSAAQFISLTTTQRNDLVVADGMVIYNTTLNMLEGRVNSAWVDLGAGAGATPALSAVLIQGSTTSGTDITISTGDSLVGAAELTLVSTTTGAVTLDSGTTGAINIGVDAVNAKTITIGNNTGATGLALESGSAGIRIDSPFVAGLADGSGLIVGEVGSGAATASALQLASFTTTERDTNLTAANGQFVYNETTNLFNFRTDSEWGVLRQDYGALAADPTGSPRDGDRYYNTVLDMEMRYDGTRAKWLSVEVEKIRFGRNGDTAVGTGYRGLNGMTYTSTRGMLAERNGTVVACAYTRSDTDAATFELQSDGVSLSTLLSSAIEGKDLTLNNDFSADVVLSPFNQTGGNTTSNVQGWFKVKWRA